MTPRPIMRSILLLTVVLAISQDWLPAVFAGPLPAPARASFNVFMTDNAFQPQSVSIQVGDSVTWRNNGVAPHTATSDDAYWNSGIMASGQSYSYIFRSTGTFQYRCSIHAGMVGTVLVQAAGQPTATPTPTSTPSGTPTSTPTVQPSATPTSSTATPTMTASPSPAATAPPATLVAPPVNGRPTILINLVDSRFMPQNLSVGVGSTLVWTNNGSLVHTIASDAELWDSVTLSPSQVFSRSFDAPGSFFYHCEFHRGAGMVGVITVTGVALPTPTSTQSPATPTPAPASEAADPPPSVLPSASSGALPPPTAQPTPAPVPLTSSGIPFPRTLPATGDPVSAQWPLLIAGCLLLAGLAGWRTGRG